MQDKIKEPIESFFYSHPVFRYEEFASWKKKQGVKDPRIIRKTLHYHTKEKHLLHLRRGLYAVVPPNETPESLLIDPYLLAAKAASDNVLAYHTALELHGVAYTVFEQFTFLTSQKSISFEYNGQWFRPTTIPTALVGKTNHHFGIEKVNRQGLTIYVTTMERTFVDVLDRIELSGGWEEIIRSIGNIAVLKIKDVVSYCLLLKNRTLSAKVGFFLEQRQGAFAAEPKDLEPLLQLKPLCPQYLISHPGEPSQLIKEWNLVLPLQVINQSWEEPEHVV